METPLLAFLNKDQSAFGSGGDSGSVPARSGSAWTRLSSTVQDMGLGSALSLGGFFG
jgi:hypothetical protein